MPRVRFRSGLGHESATAIGAVDPSIPIEGKGDARMTQPAPAAVADDGARFDFDDLWRLDVCHMVISP